MTRHTRGSVVRALCAAAWLLPGAIWLAAAPAMAAGVRADMLWKRGLPVETLCGMRGSFVVELAAAARWGEALESGEVADSLAVIARDPAAKPENRARALQMLAPARRAAHRQD